jgi:hypothetical protein
VSPRVVLAAIGLPAAWLAWAVLERGDVPAAAAYATSYEQWLTGVPLGAWPVILRDNLLAVFVHTGHLLMQPVLPVVTMASRPLVALASGAVAAGVIAWAARRVGGPVPWVLAAYVGLAVLWPWPPSRFLVVVLPVAFLPVAVASRGRLAGRIATSVALAMAALSAGHALSSAQHAEAAAGLPTSGGPVAAWDEYEALFKWVREKTPRHALVASVAEPMVYLYADRLGVFPFEQDTVAINYSSPPSIGTAMDLDRRIDEHGVWYLVRMPAPAWGHTDLLDGVIAALRAREPGRLRPVYAGRDPRFEVLAVQPHEDTRR